MRTDKGRRDFIRNTRCLVISRFELSASLSALDDKYIDAYMHATKIRVLVVGSWIHRNKLHTSESKTN